jgi:flagellar protein FlbD
VIRVTRINSTPIVLNCDLIEQVQTVPDTMIALTNGKHLLVQESVEEIVNRVIAFRSRILQAVCAGDCPSPNPRAD